jgi:hypothetical protein
MMKSNRLLGFHLSDAAILKSYGHTEITEKDILKYIKAVLYGYLSKVHTHEVIANCGKTIHEYRYTVAEGKHRIYHDTRGWISGEKKLIAQVWIYDNPNDIKPKEFALVKKDELAQQIPAPPPFPGPPPIPPPLPSVPYVRLSHL